ELEVPGRSAPLKVVEARGELLGVTGGVPQRHPRRRAEVHRRAGREQHALGHRGGQRGDVRAGEVVVEHLHVAPAVLGVAEGAVLGHADAVAPAVARQGEHGRRLRGARQEERGRRRDTCCESSRHADTIGTSVQGLELCAGKDRPGVPTVTARRRPPSTPVKGTADNLPTMGRLRSLPTPVRTVLDTVITLAVAVAIAWLGQAFVVKPYRVPTPSMVPTV